MREPQSGHLKRLHTLSEGSLFFWRDGQGEHHGYLVSDGVGDLAEWPEAPEAPDTPDVVTIIEQDRHDTPILLNANLLVTLDLTPQELAAWWMSQWEVSRETGITLIGFSAFGPDGKMQRRAVESLPLGALILYSGEGHMGYGFLETREGEGLNRLQIMWLDGPRSRTSPTVVSGKEQVALDMLPAELAQLYMQVRYLSVNSHPVSR